MSYSQEKKLPEEITSNIMDTSKYNERVEKTKIALRRFKNYYSQYRHKHPDYWTVNSFQDFINILNPIFENKDLINEPWFSDYHKILFIEFLYEFRSVFGEYTGSQMGRGHDDFVLHVVKTVNQQLISPLEEMKKIKKSII